MIDTPEVSILIVNYHTAAELAVCVQSIRAQTAVSYQVIVVDNASDKDQAVLLETMRGPDVHIHYSADNLGFGRANNLAAQQATGKLLLILNPDTCLRQTDLLRRYIDAYYDQNVAMLVPVIVESGKRKTVLPHTCYPSQRYCRYTDFSTLSGTYAWALGACLLIARDDYLAIDGFDSDFFMYGEDVDFCWRVRAKLGAIGLAADVSVDHIGGASEKGAASLAKWQRKRHGQYTFFRKHYHAQDILRIALRHRCAAAFKLFKNACLNRIFGICKRRQDEDARATATMMVSADYLSLADKRHL